MDDRSRGRRRYEDRWVDFDRYRRIMFERFALTIGLSRQVTVTVKNMTQPPFNLVGYPAVERPQVIYLEVAPARLIGIPKAYVIDIDSYVPEQSAQIQLPLRDEDTQE